MNRKTRSRDASKRRDNDAVRTYADGRLAYWTGGRPGAGNRVFERHRSQAAAETRAVELRVSLARTNGFGPHTTRTMDELVQDMLDQMRRAGEPEGTVRQYKSNWNRWTPDFVGKTRCHSISLRHYTAFFDKLSTERASESTVAAVARTLGAVVKWGHARGYFVHSEPFGDARSRNEVVDRAKRRARQRTRELPKDPNTGQTRVPSRPSLLVARIALADSEKHYPRQLCPTLPDVEKLAAAVEAVYPGYGRRLVLMGYGTGLRLLELLALREEALQLATGELDVFQQLDRYNPWPAVVPPKGGKTRPAIIWACYSEVAESLAADALARDPDDPHHGWLFPRHRSVTAWAAQAGKLIGQARTESDWPWRFHWLRHAFASQSLAPTSVGGYGLDPVSVQHWLGHARLSVTQDMYLERQSNDAAVARQRTRRPPKSLDGR